MRRDIRIASPCKADWNHMVGDDRVRHCAECNLNVYNFSAMSRAEVDELITNREGRLCARFYQRRDGTILTKDCPVGFQMKVRRVSRAAGAALIAIMGVAGAAAQTGTSKAVPLATHHKSKESEIVIKVFDPGEAVIPGAKIKILDKSGVEHVTGVTDQSGDFKANIPPGIYLLSIEMSGFRNPRETVEIKPNETVDVHMALDLAVMGGVMVYRDDVVEPEHVEVPSKIEPVSPAIDAATTGKKKNQ